MSYNAHYELDAEECRLEKIQTCSDYYKEVFGYRPRHATLDDELVAAYDVAHAEMERRRSTPEGRNRLRDQGWRLEGDPSWDYRE